MLAQLGALDQLFVQSLVQVMVFIQYIGDAARHTGGKILAGAAEDDDFAACHIFASMLADALDDGCRARIAHTKALARDTVDKRLAARRAIESDVADDDVFLRFEAAVFIGINDQLTAR